MSKYNSNTKGTQSALGPRDTSFLALKKVHQPEIKVHLEIRFNFRSVLLDFQSFTEKPVFECLFAYPMILFYCICIKQYLSRLCYMQISYEMVTL